MAYFPGNIFGSFLINDFFQVGGEGFDFMAVQAIPQVSEQQKEEGLEKEDSANPMIRILVSIYYRLISRIFIFFGGV